MFRKLFTFIVAATLTLGMAGSALALFQDFHLIRVVYERGTGSTETLTDLGEINALIAAGGSFPGVTDSANVTNPANLFVAYFALDGYVNGQLWATSTTGITLGDLTTMTSGSSNVYNYYNGPLVIKGVTATGQNFGIGVQTDINSYRNKLSATAGTLSNALSIAAGAEKSLGSLVGATSGSVSQTLYFWADGYGSYQTDPALQAAANTGVAVATITTNFDGSTTISGPPATFTVNFITAGNGTLTGTASQAIISGAAATAVTAVPATGYHFVNWTGTGATVISTNKALTVSNVTADQTITANFAIDAVANYTINFISGGNGTISGTTPQTVNAGASATAVTAVPDSGYEFVNWTGSGGFTTTAANPLTVKGVTANQTITANFAAIIKTTPAITWATPADIPYGTALSATQLNATAGGIAGTFAYTPAVGTILNAGTDQILSVTFTPSNTTLYNTPTATNVLITVGKAALTVTATNASRTYGAANPAAPGFTTSALVGSDAISSVTYTYAASAHATAAVGTTHSLTPGAAVFSSGSTANYSITYVPGTLTISGTTTQTISFTATSTATYGDAAIPLTATATSSLPVSFTLVSGPATLSGTNLTITGAGSIVIKATQAGGLNYAAAADVAQTITVAAKALTITANDTSRAYGAANPATPGFTAPTLAGTDAISSVSFMYAPTADATAAVGSSHTITPGAAAFSSGSAANYSITYAPGTLTIALSSQSITFTNPGVKSFGTAPTLTATASSGLALQFSTVTTDICTLSAGGTLTFLTSGICTVTATQAGNESYAAAAPVTHNIPVVVTAPGAPTAVTATAGNTEATVSFTAPASNGGSTIIGYTVISSPGGLIGTGTAGPITVTGLTNNTAYTFTVTAKNGTATGPASAASNSATPLYPPIKFTVSPTSGPHGSINPATPQSVTASATTSFVVTPDNDSQILSVSGCGGTLDRSTSTYTTAGILGNCTVAATFIAKPLVALQDALKALRFAIGLESPSSDNERVSADVAPLEGCSNDSTGKTHCISKPDGKIDIADVVAIMQKSVENLSW